MSKSSADVVLCEPTDLYNILTKGTRDPAFLDETYLFLLDAREISAYYRDHVILARSAHVTVSEGMQFDFRIPFDLNLPTTQHCVVYDSKTISKIEKTPAVQLANKLALSGSKNPVMILKGGYERFSAEYPFLRTEKIIYTQRELQQLPRYPSEILPLFLYLGNKCDAYSSTLNYNLKIHAHLALGNEVSPAFPEKIESLHLKINDDPAEKFSFPEICNFIETCWNKSKRVLVFEEEGCSRSATAVIAYLIKNRNFTFKGACEHLKKCRYNVLPLETFLDQLSDWEIQVLNDV